MTIPEAIPPQHLGRGTPRARPGRRRGAGSIAALALAGAVAGCVVVPQTREVFDPECRTLTRQMTLESAVVGGLHSCAGDGCAAVLVAAGVVTAASAVVSGSIALVGNVVYWFERQGRCVRPPAPAASAPS